MQKGIKLPKNMKLNLPEMPFLKPLKKFFSENKIFSIGVLAMLIAFGAGFLLRGTFIAATVNGRPISRFAVVRQLEKRQGVTTLEGLVTESLIRQEAKKQGLKVSDEEIAGEIATIEESLKQQGQSLEQVLEFQGMSQKELESQIALQKMIEKLLANQVTVTDEEINQYMEDNRDSFPEGTDIESLKETIRQQLSQQKLGTAFQPWFDEIKNSAKINYYTKY